MEGVAAAAFFSSFSSFVPSSLSSPELGAGAAAFFSNASSRAERSARRAEAFGSAPLAELVEPRCERGLDAVEPARHLRQLSAEIVRLGAPVVVRAEPMSGFRDASTRSPLVASAAAKLPPPCLPYKADAPRRASSASPAAIKKGLRPRVFA